MPLVRLPGDGDYARLLIPVADFLSYDSLEGVISKHCDHSILQLVGQQFLTLLQTLTS